jgi:Zn-dependent peptidase ImmA (M78 family)
METVRVGGRRYSDPDVISLIRATGELVDPRSAVVNQARRLNQEYRSYEGGASNPFKRLEIIASLRGFTVSPMNIEQRKSEPRDAILIPNGNARRIKGQIFYNPLRPPGRVAFSVAHEISHTFFPNTVTGARFRDLTASDSREANELERLCDLAASELLMPIEEFQAEVRGFFSLTRTEELAAKFGSSFEAMVFRLATAHPDVAVAGLLKYRRRMDEERKLAGSVQESLFHDLGDVGCEVPSPKYRRQSFFASTSCRDEYTIRWNKSFASESCVYLAAKSDGVCTAVEVLPNQSRREGLLEVVRAPFQRDDAHPEFPDLLFFWST